MNGTVRIADVLRALQTVSDVSPGKLEGTRAFKGIKVLMNEALSVTRKKAARAAVEASRAPVVTRPAKCQRCRTQNVVPADGSARCPQCGAGGL